MKRLLFAILSMTSIVSAAYAGVDVAAFTPDPNDLAVKENGWMPLEEAPDSTSWYTLYMGNLPNWINITIKTANKAIGNGYSTIDFTYGMIDCSGVAEGNYPTDIVNVNVYEVSASTGYPIQGNGSTQPIFHLPLQRGTLIGDAVKKACDFAAYGPGKSKWIHAYEVAISRVIANFWNAPANFPDNGCVMHLVVEKDGSISKSTPDASCKLNSDQMAAINKTLDEMRLPTRGFEPVLQHNIDIKLGPTGQGR